jgi:hypothetical protein
MLAKIGKTFLALTIAAAGCGPAAAGMSNGTLYFRYKQQDIKFVPPSTEEKDVVAFFIGGIGYAFSEELPLKPEWQDDNWRIKIGSALPAGLSFNPVTRTFEGTPTTAVRDLKVSLEGVNLNGAVVAEARVSFDIYAIQGAGIPVDFYAHLGKFHTDELPIPAGMTVDSWQTLTKPPAGITISGPYFEGAPTEVGQSRVMIIGIANNKPVVSFFGKYTVEAGPTFPHIADWIRNIPARTTPPNFPITVPGTYAINRAIDPATPVRYAMEMKAGDSLPEGVSVVSSVPTNYRLDGSVTIPYETTTIRWKAVDSDGTVGYSNWFRFGTGDPELECNASPIPLYTGTATRLKVPNPIGSQGRIEFKLVSGSLPTGLDYDADGNVTGTPAVSGERQTAEFAIEMTVNGGTSTTRCEIGFVVYPGGVHVTDTTAQQSRHLRLGSTYTGTAAIAGGIRPYSVAFADTLSSVGYSFVGPTADKASVTVTGQVSKAGLNPIGLKLSNGDGYQPRGALSVYGYPALSVGTVPTIVVKRLAGHDDWGRVPYDESSIIPDVSALTAQPRFTVAGASSLPSGIVLDEGGHFTGKTTVAAGTYGPYKVALRDFSDGVASSEDFNVVILPRDDIAFAGIDPPTFRAEWDRAQTRAVATLVQPPGARSFAVTWSISGAVPSWLSLEATTGRLTAATSLPLAEKGVHGPFTLTATDEEGSTVTSSAFDVTVEDWPTPSADHVIAAQGTVSGNAAEGETATWMNISNLRDAILPDTVIGGKESVTFVSADPSSPAGLTFDAATGSFSGRPTSDFNDAVTVSFKDGRGRSGVMSVPFEVRSYPAATMTQTSYEIPRLALAQGLPTPVEPAITATWNAPAWSLDVSKGSHLPAGLSVDPASGRIEGKATAPVGTTVDDIYLRADSNGANGERLKSWAGPFSIAISEPEPLTLRYSEPKTTYYLKRNGGSFDYVRQDSIVPLLGGSFVDPVQFSLDKQQATAEGLTGTLSVNSSNGNITGSPSTLGVWTVDVTASDAEGRKSPSAALVVKSTLDGRIEHDGPSDLVERTLRVNEPFSTPVITVTNEVGAVAFSTQSLPASLDFSSLTGSFSDQSHFAAPTPAGGVYVSIEGTDEDGRKLRSPLPSYHLTALPALTASLTPEASVITGRAYDAGVFERMQATLKPKVEFAIGRVTYTLSGVVPGTLVHHRYDPAGTSLGYDWTSSGGIAQHADVASSLPADALVFDTLSATLTGVPSQSGTFSNIVLKVVDSHQNDYEKDVADRVSANTATIQNITIEIKAAPSLAAVSTVGGVATTTEALARYTTQASLVTTVSNAARGEPVAWTKVSGTIPPGVTPRTTDNSVVYSGYPTEQGVFPNIVWRATDAAGRSILTSAVSFNVGARLPLTLVAEDNPVYAIVNGAALKTAVTATNTALGQGIRASDWTVVDPSALPPGVTFSTDEDGLTFSGVATTVGSFNAQVRAVDAGGTATLVLPFNIMEPVGDIGLSVSNIRTKVGYPVLMQPSVSNTYGTLRFYSFDIDGDPQTHVAGKLAQELDIALAGGAVTGSFQEIGEHPIDVYVTDTTKRVTSKALTISVIPDLRITVPAEVPATQGETLSRTIATDYVVGAASYEKANPELWPEGVDIDPTTGTIGGIPTAGAGRYEGLRVRATDTFTVAGQTYTDVELSNEFTVVIAPINASPVIADISGNKLAPGAKGGSFAFTPTVKDSRFSRPWNYPGTVYSVNKPVSQFGLSFDTATGRISGIPTSGGVIPDLVITVTAASGDSDSTAPFWLGIAPDGPIAAVAGQKVYIRKNKTGFRTAPVVFTGTVGTVTYSRLQGNGGVGFDDATGQFYYVGDFTWWSPTDYPATIRVTDEFGRTAETVFTLVVREGLTATFSDISTAQGAAVNSKVAAIGNALGTSVVTISGLPAYLSVDPSTGTVTGTVPEGERGKTYALTVTVTDSADNASISGTSTITVSNAILDKACIPAIEDNRYASQGGSQTWFVSFHGNLRGTRAWTGAQNVEIADVRFYDANGDCYIPSTTKTFAYSDGKSAEPMADGNPATSLLDFTGSGIYFNFGNKHVVFTDVVVTMKGGTLNDLNMIWVCRGNDNNWGTSLMNNCAPKAAKFNANGALYAPGEKRRFTFGNPSWVYYTQIDYTE